MVAREVEGRRADRDFAEASPGERLDRLEETLGDTAGRGARRVFYAGPEGGVSTEPPAQRVFYGEPGGDLRAGDRDDVDDPELAQIEHEITPIVRSIEQGERDEAARRDPAFQDDVERARRMQAAARAMEERARTVAATADDRRRGESAAAAAERMTAEAEQLRVERGRAAEEYFAEGLDLGRESIAAPGAPDASALQTSALAPGRRPAERLRAAAGGTARVPTLPVETPAEAEARFVAAAAKLGAEHGAEGMRNPLLRGELATALDTAQLLDSFRRVWPAYRGAFDRARGEAREAHRGALSQSAGREAADPLGRGEADGPPAPGGGGPQEGAAPAGEDLQGQGQPVRTAPAPANALAQLARKPRKGEWSKADVRRRLEVYAAATGPELHPEHQDQIDAARELGDDVRGQSEFSTSFGGKVPAEITEALEGRALTHLRMHLHANVKGGGGEDAHARLGTDEYVRYLEQWFEASHRKAIRVARRMAPVDPGAEFLVFLHDTARAKGPKKPPHIVDQPGERLPAGAQMRINGRELEVDTFEGEKVLSGQGDDFTLEIPLRALDTIPIDAGSLRLPEDWEGPAIEQRRTRGQGEEQSELAPQAQRDERAPEGVDGGDHGLGDAGAEPRPVPGARSEQRGVAVSAEDATPTDEDVTEVPDFAADVARDRGANLSGQLDPGGREVGPVTGRQQALPLPLPSRLEEEIASRQVPEDTETMPFWNEGGEPGPDARTAGGVEPDDTLGPPGQAMGAAAAAEFRVLRRIGHALMSVLSGGSGLGGLSSIVTPAGRSALGVKLVGAMGRLRARSAPRIYAADEASGDAAVEYASSRIYGRRLAIDLIDQLLGKRSGDQSLRSMIGAVLVEDNLRSIRSGFRRQGREARAKGNARAAAAAQERADNVRTLVRTPASGRGVWETEAEYQEALRAARPWLARFAGIVSPVTERLYREASEIAADEDLPTRGEQTGVRINLKRAESGDRATFRFGPGNIRNPVARLFKRKSPFARMATGAAEAYAIDVGDIIENSVMRQIEIANRHRLYKTLVQRGQAVIAGPGEEVRIHGEDAVAFPIRERIFISKTKDGEDRTYSQNDRLHVRKSIAAELKAVLQVNDPTELGLVSRVGRGLTWTSLFGLADAFTHVANVMGRVAVVGGSNRVERIAAAAGGVPAMLVGLEMVLRRTLARSTSRLADLARIGAMRDVEDRGRSITRITGRFVRIIDESARLALDDTFQHLQRRGLVKDTPRNRREFVNQVGQYNQALQGALVRFLRQSNLGPFATAGTAATIAGVRSSLGLPGVEASTPAAAGKLWARQVALIASTALQAALIGYWITGRFGGRPGVPIGAIDLGDDDERGRPRTLDLFELLGIRRGLRALGVNAMERNVRQGRGGGGLDDSARDAVGALLHPAMGPLVRWGAIALFGGTDPRFPEAKTVPPGRSQLWENVKTATKRGLQFFPRGEGATWTDALREQLGRFGRLGRGLSRKQVRSGERRIHAAELNDYIDDQASRLRREPIGGGGRTKAMREAAKQLEPADRVKFYREMRRRRVLAP